MIKYGPTIENLNTVRDKAKSKKDGVYSFRGLEYRVFSGQFTHFAYRGEILIRAGNFNVSAGTYSGYSDDAKKALKAIQA